MSVSHWRAEGWDCTGFAKALPCCHPDPFAVILSPFASLRVNFAKNLDLRIFMTVRDSSFAEFTLRGIPEVLRTVSGPSE